MFKDLKENWRTTLAGLIACGFAAWYLYEGEYAQSAMIASVGFGLIAGKDSLNKPNNNP